MIYRIPHWLLLLFLLAWPPNTKAIFSPEDVTPVARYAMPNCDDEYEECVPDEYDDCEPEATSESGLNWKLKYLSVLEHNLQDLFTFHHMTGSGMITNVQF